MRFIGVVVILLGLSIGAAAAQDCHLHRYASLPITRTPEGLMLPVKIGDQTAEMSLDMADPSSSLTMDAAKRLDLRLTHMPDGIHVHRGGGTVEFIAHAPKVSLGEAAVADMQFYVLPDTASDKRDGDIGTHLFANDDMELDLAAGKLNLFDSDHCSGTAVYWTNEAYTKVPVDIEDGGYLRVQMMLDGKPVSLGLGTEGRSVLLMDTMQRLFGLGPNSPGMTLVSTRGDGARFWHYDFQALQAGGLGIAHPAIEVIENPNAHKCVTGQKLADGGVVRRYDVMNVRCYGGEDGVLGLPILAKLHVYLSRKEKLLYLTGAGAH